MSPRLTLLFFAFLVSISFMSRSATTYTVTNTNSSGAGSLHAAITACASGDVVVFNFSSGSAPFVINATFQENITVSNITIKGQTAAGYTPGNPVVQIDGANSLNYGFDVQAPGFTITGISITQYASAGIYVEANNCTVQNCFIGVKPDGVTSAPVFCAIWAVGVSGLNVDGVTFGHNVFTTTDYPGVYLQDNGTGCSGAIIKGNYIGMDKNGTVALGTIGYGVYMDFNSSGNLIGGSTAAERNVIGNCSNFGVHFGGTNNAVKGNYIGINAAGTAAIPNLYGVYSEGSNSTLGGTGAGEGNVISGNSQSGVLLDGFSKSQTMTVIGNYIGTNAAGTAAIPNAADGIYIQGTFSGASNGHVIGGTAAGAGNIISGNTGIGIDIVQSNGTVIAGNIIGLNAAGTAKIPNTADGVYIDPNSSTSTIGGTTAVSGNTISGNTQNGINIQGNSNTVQFNYIGLNKTGTAALGNTGSGINILSSSGGKLNTISNNIISGNTVDGISLNGSVSASNTITANYIGLNATGTAAIANAGTGITIRSMNNIIGGNTAAARNIISGNTNNGIAVIVNGSNTISGNYIGVNPGGSAAIANGLNGIIISGSGITIVGGSTAGQGNLISGNLSNGISITSGNHSVLGNYIGTNAGGTSAIANGSNGISLSSTTSNTIGGSSTGQGNLISGNTGNGITISTNSHVILGNYIGVNLNANAAIPNGVSGINITGNSNTIGTPGTVSNIIAGNIADGILISGTNNVVIGNYIGGNASSAIANGANGINITSNTNTIGGTTLADGNLISGNTTNGILISGATNSVLGNYIGVDGSGITAMANGFNGISITGSSNKIGGGATGSINIISGNTGAGVSISGSAGSNKIQGNYIGVTAIGTAAKPNGSAITIAGTGTANIIGTDADGTNDATEFNVIAGNSAGITISSNSNTVAGNYIGVNKTGTGALSNHNNGITISGGATSNSIGGSTAVQRNIISGHSGFAGILINSTGSNNSVYGNYIGLNAAGTTAIPNTTGISVSSSSAIIGATGQGNVISGNSSHGIQVTGNTVTIKGNYIGTSPSGSSVIANGGSGIIVSGTANGVIIGGSAAGEGNTILGNTSNGVTINGLTGNLISGNSISNNGALGIDLGNNGVTPNDIGDADAGSNNLQNYPILTSVDTSGGSTIIVGTLNSIASTLFKIEFFENVSINASGYGEGKVYLGNQTTTTNVSGNATFTFVVSGNHQKISATATDPSNNTSEFCAIGLPEIAVSYNSIDIADGTATPNGIDSTSVGYPVIRTYKISNVGGEALTLSGLTLPSGFSALGPLPAVVQAGTSINLQIQLDALANGTYSGTLSFANNDANENPFDFAIKGWVGCTSINAPAVTVVNNCNGTSDLTAGNYTGTLVWSNGASTTSINVNNTATYTVTQTIKGCVSATGSGTSAPRTTPIVTINSGVICSGQSFTMTPGGADTYTYSSGTNVVSPMSNQSYSVTGTSVDGCLSSNIAVSSVTVNITPTVTVNDGTICSGQSFTITPSGADTYTYSSGISVVSPTTTTSYSITGTSVDGCLSSNIAVSSVTVNITPVVTVNSGTICTGQSFTITPSGADTYTYSSGTNIVSPMSDQTYTVTGTSIQGCIGSGNAISSVIVNTTPTVTVNDGTICSGNSFTMTPSGADTYTYSSGTNVVNPMTNSTYSVTGTSIDGCLSSNTAISSVTVNITPTVTVNNGTICTGQSFTMTPGGANTYTYSSGTNVVSPLTTNTYSITGTSLEGCVSSNTAISSVTVNITPTVTVNDGTICSGNSFTMTPSGADTYTYSSGSNVVSPMVNSTYNITGTSVEGCVSSNTAISSVTVNITPTVTVNDGTICSGNSFTMTPSGADTYTYSSGTNVVNPTSNQTYTVTGTSIEGCLSSNLAVSSVTVNTTPVVTVNSGTICSGESFTITPSGADTYTYSSGGNVVSPASNQTYTITGTSLQGCAGSGNAISSVVVNATPTITVNDGTICSGNSFTMTPGGANTYTYSSGTNVVNPMTNSTYSVVGTSIDGCLSSNTAISSVTVNITPTVTVNDGTMCTGQSFTITPGGANTYTYSSGSNIVSPISNQSYSVTGTSIDGCLSSNTAISSVTVNITPTVTVSDGTICSGQSFTMTPSGADTYTYSSGTNVVSPTNNQTYSVTGASIDGCLSSNTAVSSVTVNITPTVTVNNGTICSGQSFTMTPSGADTYTYSSGTNIVNPVVNTTYSVSGTALNGCISSNTAVSSVTVNITPVIAVNSGAICAGDSFTITPSGANTYTYSSGTNTVNPLTDNTYTVTGSSLQGCVSSNTVIASVTVNATPSITVNSGAICSGDSFTITPGGANTYTYSSGTNIVTPGSSTSYSVTGTSALGCISSNTAIVNVAVNATPTITVNSGAICTGNSFTIVPSGANTYTYSGGSNIVSPTSNTSYSISGTGLNGCVSTANAISQVTVNSLPNTTIVATSTSICVGSTSLLSASGATSYTWNTGATSNSISVSPTTNTTYTVLGSNGIGCDFTATINLSVNPNPTVTIGGDVEIKLEDTYQFNPTQTGAVSYTWSPVTNLSDSSIINPITNTQTDITYTLTVTSVNGCKASDEVNVKVLTDLVIANYLSPNGDGVNDTWKVSVPALIKNCSVEIIDTWGKIVFSKESDYNNEWAADDLPAGVYYYTLKDGNTLKHKGSITVTK